ncbi:MAG: amidohydrolase, partial [Planctomycetes bacterium]|nr:amidohydrolase [Planctomycetota bacterium]
MMYIKILVFFLIFFLILSVSCENSTSEQDNTDMQMAELVLRGGQIVTVDEDFSIREAVAVSEGKIIFVGDNAGIEPYINADTKIIDLNGKLVLPGMVDCLGNMHILGNKLARLDVSGTKSFEEIIDIVGEKAQTLEPGQWIIGGRWDQNDWQVKEFPVHDRLSEVTPDNPVFLDRVDGTSILVNRQAMEIAGITKDTPPMYGGEITRKANGEPTGVFTDRASLLISRHLPAEDQEQYRQKFLNAVEHSLALGLTGWHEIGVSSRQIDFYRELIDSNRLKMRVNAILGERDILSLNPVMFLSRNRIDQYGNYFLVVRGVRLTLDGALGSRGALLFKPYADDPNNYGIIQVEPDYVYQLALAALQTGMSMTTNCIGTEANWLCLNAYEKALSENPIVNHRLRIGHAQVVRPEDIARFSRLGIIPSMQPTHCTSDMDFVIDRIGPERARGAYAWRSFLDAGCIIP